jgi:hypothetical protein
MTGAAQKDCCNGTEKGLNNGHSRQAAAGKAFSEIIVNEVRQQN